jgi:hypothetical protein
LARISVMPRPQDSARSGGAGGGKEGRRTFRLYRSTMVGERGGDQALAQNFRLAEDLSGVPGLSGGKAKDPHQSAPPCRARPASDFGHGPSRYHSPSSFLPFLSRPPLGGCLLAPKDLPRPPKRRRAHRRPAPRRARTAPHLRWWTR